MGRVSGHGSLAAMNPVPAALGLLGAITGMAPDKDAGSVYSYLFEARRTLT